MKHGMGPTPHDEKAAAKIVGALILIAIILIIIAIIAVGVFSTSPQANIPALASITPHSGAAGTLVPVTIEGANFAYGPTPSVWLVKTGANNITATDVLVVSPSLITCTIPLTASSVSAGQWDVVVKNADGLSGSKPGAFTVVNEIAPPLKWDWSLDGWGDWQHVASCAGTTASGSCVEYGPFIVDGHGEYGSNVTLDRVPTESSISKTFTASSGARWNTLTFNGLLSSSTVPYARWMAIDVNGVNVFYTDATRTPPGNGRQFTITQPFPPANTVNVIISSGQDPTFGTSLYTMQYNSLTLGWSTV